MDFGCGTAALCSMWFKKSLNLGLSKFFSFSFLDEKKNPISQLENGQEDHPSSKTMGGGFT